MMSRARGLGPGASVRGGLGCSLGHPQHCPQHLGPLDAVWGNCPGCPGHPGPKARQPYWILKPLQNFHRQFLESLHFQCKSSIPKEAHNVNENPHKFPVSSDTM